MAGREGSQAAPSDVDVVVVGAGFSGLYLLHRLRRLGFSTRVLDAAGDVGGTWYWNRYPGARCDIPTTDYTYSFDPELERDVDVVGEVRHPARDPGLPAVTSPTATTSAATSRSRPGSTSAVWDEPAARWRLRTDGGEEISCRFYVMASGCLSLPKAPDIAGHDRFGGEVYFTEHVAPRGRSTSPASGWR